MKERLDVLLVKHGLAESREKAKAIIMSGIVYVEDQKEDKAGSTFEEGARVEVRGSTLKYVSRGGLKLEKAMTHFGVSLAGKICMDVGSSTGGFTDCMLQNGAVKVYAVDVGHGQLAWKLRNDARVVCMEKTNIRYVTPSDIQDPIQFASIDVSFISLKKVLGPVKSLLTGEGQIVCLIKPQFEAGREKVGKKGVVREKSVHLEVIHSVIDFAQSIGFKVLNLEFSPIKGPEGNIEYLLYLQNHADGEAHRGDGEMYRGDEETYRGDEETYRGDEETYRGDGKTYRGDEETYRGDGKTYRGDGKTYRGDGETYRGDKEMYRWDGEMYRGDEEMYRGDGESHCGDKGAYSGNRKPSAGPAVNPERVVLEAHQTL